MSAVTSGTRGRKRRAESGISSGNNVPSNQRNPAVGRPRVARKSLDRNNPANWTTAELRSKLENMGFRLPPGLTRKSFVRIYELNRDKDTPLNTDCQQTSSFDRTTDNMENPIETEREGGGLSTQQHILCSSDTVENESTDLRKEFNELKDTVHGLSNAIHELCQNKMAAATVSSNEQLLLASSPVATCGNRAMHIQPDLESDNDNIPEKRSFGVASHDLPKIVNVSETMRKNIVQGKYVNLAALLIPAHEMSDGRSIMDISGNEIRIKGSQDPRLNKSLTLSEFLVAFGRYKSVICDAYPNRREELDLYEADIIDMATSYGTVFYDYHVQFTMNAASWLQQKKIKVDWSVRDNDIFIKCTAGRKAAVCAICNSTLHMHEFCPRKLSWQPRNQTPLNSNDKRGRARVYYNGKEICNNYNSENGCTRSGCFFLHICSACKGNHPVRKCTKSAANKATTQ